jgi:hypothetical protein
MILAHTEAATRLPRLYSDLHQNIQDKFNEAGVEIMSPRYSSLRDGNSTTVPEDHRPSTYQPPGFRLTWHGEQHRPPQDGAPAA